MEQSATRELVLWREDRWRCEFHRAVGGNGLICLFDSNRIVEQRHISSARHVLDQSRAWHVSVLGRDLPPSQRRSK